MQQHGAEGEKSLAGSFFWNTLGGILNAGQSVLVLAVLTRVLGLAAAGIYSIAFATGNLFLYLGEYGVRNVQVSDLSERYSFRDYLAQRYLTVGLMLVLSALFAGVSYLRGSYCAEKALTVFAMCLLKAVDCLEEVFEGRLHQRGRLDLAGKVMTVRLLFSIGGMLLAALLTGSLLAATLAAVVLALLSASGMILLYRGEVALAPGKSSRKNVLALMRVCFPVCAANFLQFYLINAPKYAIDAAMDETAQARYNFIAMPVFVIQLLGMFLYQPILGRMSAEAESRDRRPLLRDIGKIVAGILLVSAVCLAGAALLGIPVLSLLYATDLSDLRGELLWILVGGIFLALDGFFCAVLTILRRQNVIPVIYLLGTAGSFLLTGRMVVSAGMLGAVLAFVFVMILVFLLLAWQLVFALRKGRE
ncbi:MAG: lipopolysaccharide biosynthesis protein [Lachnospiraceae bacterium]|jgi:O-antigen/teichoic acid export membrane protein|nr:lipopolysaccharide biosynthesis protein [Lachnospiraceae bacterium]MCI1397175.1 lipopolysaccharide biosynthesis protein [Lachnospiraceae bacterium]MCI1422813.1 lipopolysaccharide biosynthesis protein [Lachnospiraceae bacterium]MCI1451498.1 lipopolysaccharide biosynthesis protein [Lachnospiraceae bacterium]